MFPKQPDAHSQTYPLIAESIIREVYRSMELLGADEQLLSLIGSWNETLSDEIVLDGLRLWVKLKKAEVRRSRAKKPVRQAGARKFKTKGSRP